MLPGSKGLKWRATAFERGKKKSTIEKNGIKTPEEREKKGGETG